MKNILLTIAYDGSGFAGWQRQPHQRTVQGEVERVLSILCGKPVQIAGTSRTDAGVHALGQRATLRGEFGIPTERIPLAANHLLAGGGHGTVGDIRILDAKEMPEPFHARFSSVGKTYYYCIYNGAQPDLFARNYCCWVEKALNPDKMNEAAQLLNGRHDFRCFMAAGGQEPESTLKTIYAADVIRTEFCGISTGGFFPNTVGQKDALLFRVTGSGFLYNMVRIIVGTLIEIGLEKRSPEEMREIIASEDRCRAGHTAPPQGLFLKQIYYSEEALFTAVDEMKRESGRL